MTEKIKIIYLIGELGLGGSERQLYLLLKHFDFDQFEPSVVVFNPSPNVVLNEALEALGVQVVAMPAHSTSVLQRVWYLVRLFRQLRPHIVHSWTIHDNAYAGVVGRLVGIPVQWGSVRGSVQDRGFQSLPGVFKWLALHAVSRLVVNAHSIQQELVQAGFASEKVEILPNCMELPPFVPSDLAGLGLQPDHRLVGIVGNLRPVKNHGMFVDAMANVLPDFPEVRALLVGHPISGYENLPDQLSARIEQLGLQGRVRLAGFRGDVPQLMRRFSIFCLTSDSEGTPNVVLEAMAAARPVVATRVGGVPEVIQEGVNGFLVEPGDVNGFARAVRMLLASPDLADQMGLAGREMVERSHGCETAVRHLTRFYLQALAEKGLDQRSFSPGSTSS